VNKQGDISVRICGIGGQGIVLAGNILAEALLRSYGYATTSASYGPEVRGTSVRADVLASRDWIAYPRAERPDFVIALAQKVYNAGLADFSKETVVLYDPVLVHPSPKCPARHIAVKASEACFEKFGDNTDANLVMLGALSAQGVLKQEDLEAAAVERISAREDARKAVALGAGLRLET
jgi:2-oxoglutarate ferredoxin oxidoreductase subunit gamma